MQSNIGRRAGGNHFQTFSITTSNFNESELKRFKQDHRDSDAYKPASVPNAWKVLYGRKDKIVQEESKMTERLEGFTGTMSVVKRIECVYLPATNTEESARWYVNHLDLKLKRPVDENQAQLGISAQQTIFLIKSKEPWNVNYTEINGSEQCIFTMEVEQFEELHSKMKQNGARVTDIADNGGCGRNFYAYDPAGNKIEIWSGWPK